MKAPRRTELRMQGEAASVRPEWLGGNSSSLGVRESPNYRVRPQRKQNGERQIRLADL